MLSRRIIRASILAIYAIVFLNPGCWTGDDGSGSGRPRNIILMIGDGMGLSQISAGRIVQGGINIERMRTVGLQSTVPSEGLVTDSAASGTAMATGYKTLNGAISVDPDGDVLKTVLEYAEEKGMMTGLVATSSITHATPAVFASHVTDRGMSGEIAWQISGSGVDLLIGGGLEWFLPRSEEGSRREDELDPLSAFGERMTVVRPGEPVDIEGSTGALAIFTAMGHPPSLPVREPGLAWMTTQALNVLSSGDSGFFLMIEGSQIDWAAHDNDLETMIMEIADFDSAVGAALDFASAEGNTLVIVTGDHETGGFSILDGQGYGMAISEAGWATGSHTATMLPVFAYGPGEDSFAGVYENTMIGKKLISMLTARDR